MNTSVTRHRARHPLYGPLYGMAGLRQPEAREIPARSVLVPPGRCSDASRVAERIGPRFSRWCRAGGSVRWHGRCKTGMYSRVVFQSKTGVAVDVEWTWVCGEDVGMFGASSPFFPEVRLSTSFMPVLTACGECIASREVERRGMRGRGEAGRHAGGVSYRNSTRILLAQPGPRLPAGWPTL